VVASERQERGVFEARARAAAEFGRRALEPGHARNAGSADAVACELYLQSAYWALVALRLAGEGAGERKLPFDLKAAMSGVPRELLLRAAGGNLGLEQVEIAAAAPDFAEALPAEQAEVALVLRTFADNLLRVLDRSEQRVWLVHTQRLTRLSIVLAALGALVATGLLSADWLEQRRDLAREKAWHASSTGVNACNSPAQFCDESPDFFFHTNEEKDPWLELDLGAVTPFSAVKIINRRDCCRDRASPLLLEASVDQKKWKPLARHDGGFSSWKASFPTQRARYLRIKISAPQPTNLHLAGVRVLP
jgi:hypothetical protein